MNYNLFWTAFGAIGATLGAFATAAAVIVALWQVKHNEMKKLRLKFTDSMILYDRVLESKQPFISLNITNIGNRDVIIDKWGFVYYEKNGYGLIGFNQSSIEQQINPILPYKLKIEETMSLYWELAFFIECIKPEIETGHLRSNRKIAFFAADSTGRMYKVKTAKVAREYIDKS